MKTISAIKYYTKPMFWLLLFSFYTSYSTAQSCFKSITAGRHCYHVILEDGTLWASGKNNYGQFGNCSNVNKRKLVKVGYGNNWKAITDGAEHSVAIKNDGSLWTWGLNIAGELGDGTLISKNAPVRVGTDNNWASVSDGNYTSFSLAIKTDGSLWAWGRNNGAFGNGTLINSLVPVQVGVGKTWKMASGGQGHTLAITTDGKLYFTGCMFPCGMSAGAPNTIFNQVGTDSDWAYAFAGDYFCAAIKTDGSLWTWGNNMYGRIGDGTTTSRSTPYRVGTENNWKTISAGHHFTLAVKTDNTLWAWGSNFYGVLGNGTTVNSYTPVQIGAGQNWLTVVAGQNHSYAFTTAFDLYAWGNNDNGELGDNTLATRLTPKLINCPACNCIGSLWSSYPRVEQITPAGGVSPLNVTYSDYGSAPVNNLTCNYQYRLGAAFRCKNMSCNRDVQVKITKAGTTIATSAASASFVDFTPTASGLYDVTFYGKCDTNTCGIARAKLSVKCLGESEGETGSGSSAAAKLPATDSKNMPAVNEDSLQQAIKTDKKVNVKDTTINPKSAPEGTTWTTVNTQFCERRGLNIHTVQNPEHDRFKVVLRTQRKRYYVTHTMLVANYNGLLYKSPTTYTKTIITPIAGAVYCNLQGNVVKVVGTSGGTLYLIEEDNDITDADGIERMGSLPVFPNFHAALVYLNGDIEPDIPYGCPECELSESTGEGNESGGDGANELWGHALEMYGDAAWFWDWLDENFPNGFPHIPFRTSNPALGAGVGYVNKKTGVLITYRPVINKIPDAFNEFDSKLSSIGKSDGSSKAIFHNIMLGVFYRLGNKKLQTDIGLNAGISIKQGKDYVYSVSYNNNTPQDFTQILFPKEASRKTSMLLGPSVKFNYNVSKNVALQFSTAYTFAQNNKNIAYTGKDLSAIQQTNDVALLRQQLKAAPLKEFITTYNMSSVQLGFGINILLKK